MKFFISFCAAVFMGVVPVVSVMSESGSLLESVYTLLVGGLWIAFVFVTIWFVCDEF